jgi:hypothetical protein
MYQPFGFCDSENIIIINKTPYFRYKGLTYKEKLKNGLSLPFLFEQECSTINIQPSEKDFANNSGENIKTKYNNDNNYRYYDDDNDDDYDDDYKKLFRKKNKKVRTKNGKAKKYKKNCIKSDGHKYKLFIIEENLPEFLSLSEPTKYSSQTINYEYNYEYNNGLTFYYYYNYDPDWQDYWSYC